MKVASVCTFLISCKYLQLIKNVQTLATSICTHILILKRIGQLVTDKNEDKFVRDLDRRKLAPGRLLRLDSTQLEC